VKLHSSSRTTHLGVDFRGWLTQTCPQPFLQTVDLTTATGEREYYPLGTENVAPVLRMACQTTPGIGGNNTALGFFKVNAKYTVRGRRAETLPITIRMNMLSPED
jgi:hypothetical protein